MARPGLKSEAVVQNGIFISTPTKVVSDDECGETATVRPVGEVAGVDTRGFGHEPNPLNPTCLRHDGWSWTLLG